MKKHPNQGQAPSRHVLVQKFEQYISKDQYPRLQMMLIVALTGLIGFLASFGMLKLGITQMVIRYPVAVLVAYLGFLGLIRLWLYWQQSETESTNTSDSSSFDVDLPNFSSSGGGGGSAVPKDFGGGSFGGGGAGGSYSNALSSPTSSPQMMPIMSDTSSSSSSSVGDIGSGLGDLDEGAVVILALLIIGAILISFFYVIYIAPALFAEILVDGALATGLYRTMRGVERRYWLTTVLGKTWWMALIVCLIVGFCGYAIQQSMPEAISIGDVLQF